jgi:hypothetical protein
MNSRTLYHVLQFVIVVVVAVTAACARPRVDPPMARTSVASIAELDVYRTVAESIYVRSTSGSVAVSRVVMDSTCDRDSCLPLNARWGADSTWWRTGDPEAWGSAVTALRNRAGQVVVLDSVAAGHPRLVVVEPESIPLATADTSTWRFFRGHFGGLAGVLRFSPVGFARGGREALVAVQWSCGPSCGHELAVALAQGEADGWGIVDVVLVGGGGGAASGVGESGEPND